MDVRIMSLSTVLVVDDSLIIRKILMKKLEKLGYKPLSVASGQEALDAMRQEPVACMILDPNMDGLNGFDVLEVLNEERINVPVIVLTADLQEASRAKAEKLGSRAFLTKPLNETEIQSTLEIVLIG